MLNFDLHKSWTGVFWNKWRRVILTLSGIAALTSIIWGWPVHYAYPVTGTIMDAVTKEPVPNAIIECEWIKKSALGIIEAVSVGMDTEYVVSNERGEYRIPGKFSLHIFSWYDSMRSVLRQPFYEVIRMNVLHNKTLYLPEHHIEMNVKSGKFACEIPLMKLEYKYSKGLRADDGVGFGETLFEMRRYAQIAKELKIKSDWDFAFKTWDKISRPYGGIKSNVKELIETINAKK